MHSKDKSHTLKLGSDSSVSNGPQLKVAVAGGTALHFTVDTGSIGLVLAYQYFGVSGKDYEPTTETFHLKYVPSGNEYTGIYVKTRVQLYVRSDDPFSPFLETAPMLVRMVQKFRSGAGGDWTTKFSCAMLGVGFDRAREEVAKGEIPTGLNPFLHLEEMVQQTMTRGFIIDLQTPCITLGLTPDNTKGFKFLQLQPLPAPDYKIDDPTAKLWATPTVWMSVPSANIGPMQASLLIDTGLSSAIVQAPLGVAPPQSAVQHIDNLNPSAVAARVQVANGQRFVISAHGSDNPIYAFEVGKRDAPTYVTWGSHTNNGMPFINASRHALSQFDYLYDDDNGRMGFYFKESKSVSEPVSITLPVSTSSY